MASFFDNGRSVIHTTFVPHLRKRRLLMFRSFIALLAFEAFMQSARAELRVTNAFQTPRQVLEHFLKRDSEGFVFSGLLESERQALTYWKESPSQDTFYVAKSHKITERKAEKEQEAAFDVDYDLVSIADAHGTLVPLARRLSKKRVMYVLRKDAQGRWKIARPEARSIVPILSQKRVQTWLPEIHQLPREAQPVSSPTPSR